jgi:stage II sporulation protein D
MVQAAEDTRGEIMLSDSQAVPAVYHASAYISTRSSEEVFGNEVKALQAVAVPHESEKEGVCVLISKSDAFKKLADRFSLPEVVYGASCTDVWNNDGCRGLVLDWGSGAITLPASQVRMALGLRSANFKVDDKGEELVFTTYGHGHGVGMSQEGAQILACRGVDYRSIVSHYYTDIVIALLKNSE